MYFVRVKIEEFNTQCNIDFETCLVAKGQKPKTPSKPKSRKP